MCDRIIKMKCEGFLCDSIRLQVDHRELKIGGVVKHWLKAQRTKYPNLQLYKVSLRVGNSDCMGYYDVPDGYGFENSIPQFFGETIILNAEKEPTCTSDFQKRFDAWAMSFSGYSNSPKKDKIAVDDIYCYVCQNRYKVGDDIYTLRCEHKIHEKCVEKLIMEQCEQCGQCQACKTDKTIDDDYRLGMHLEHSATPLDPDMIACPVCFHNTQQKKFCV